jgi:outer membrane protein OmpA-like peptidoglycan-associated protein/tetratricopeptide (TPR) repeat protein
MKRKGIILLILVFQLIPAFVFAQLKYANILFEEKNYVEAIPLYERTLEKKGETIEVIERLAFCYKVINDYAMAEKYFAKAVTYHETDPSSHLYYGQLLKNDNKINQARQQFTQYTKKKPGSLIGKLMLRSCDDIMDWSSQPIEFKILNLKEINTEFNEIGPFPYGDQLIFTSEKRYNSVAKQKKKKGSDEETTNYSIYVLQYDNKVPGAITTLFPESSENDFEGPAYFNSSHDVVYFNKVFDTRRFLVNQIKIFYAQRVEGGWSAAKPFYLNSNEYTITNPVLSTTGDTLFFSSDMEGGYGGMDIYFCVKRDQNNWGKAVNLGPLVNTEGIEIPSYYNNSNVLYFSSNFHPGYGGFDVFRSKWSGATWSKPENLKSPLNSSKDELGFIEFNDLVGYFSSNRDGGSGNDDIYRFELMDTSDLSNYTQVSGVFEYRNLPLEDITLSLLDENDVLIQSAVTNKKGEFTFKGIPPGANYQIIVDEPAEKIPDGAKLYLTNSRKQKIKLLNQVSKGLFKFEALPADEVDLLPLMSEEDDESIQRISILGEVYNKLSMDLPEGMEVYLLDDEGNIRATAVTGKNGEFEFTDLQLDESFLFRLAQKDPDLGLNILNSKKELLAATKRNENGEFVYLTNFQKTVKNPDVSGVFKYGKLPASDVILELMSEQDELLQRTKTNEKGEFTFKQLDAGTNYGIKVADTEKKVPKNAMLFLRDAATGLLLPVGKNGKGTFQFKTLAYDEAEELSLIEEEEDDNRSRITLLGEVYHKLSMDLPEGLEVFLLDDEGNIVATAITKKDGKFAFKDVASSDQFLLRLSQKDPNLELKIINNKGQLLGSTSRNDQGDFVYLTNLQKTVKTPDVAGVFKYGKLPAADVQLNLMDENDEIIKHTRTNQNGEFTFEKLAAGKNYAIKVDPSAGKVPENARLFLTDKHTGQLLPVAKLGNATFNFQTLAYDEVEELSLIEEEDDDNRPRITLLGEVYHKLSMDLPEGLEVFLLDDEGNIVATAITKKDGKFAFKDVASSDQFLLRLSQKDPNLELKIINNKGQLLGSTSRNDQGDFVYLTNLQKTVKTPDVAGVFKYGKLPAADVQLNLMDENDEIIKHTRTNQNGEFTFGKLAAGKNYAIKVDPSAGKVPENARLFLTDKHTGQLLPVAKLDNATFNFQTLAYDEVEELSLIEEEEDAQRNVSFLKGINYSTLPLDLPEGMELFLVDDEGNIISRTLVDKKHRYKFEKLEMDEAELALLLENDEQVNFRIVSKDGTVIANLKRNAAGTLIAIASAKKAKPSTTSAPASTGRAPSKLPSQHTTLSGGDEEVIYYAFSDWRLSKKAAALLDQIILRLHAQPNLKLSVNTHADARGEDEYNLWLSKRRASIIQQYLLLEDIDLNRVIVYTYGEAKLVNDCDGTSKCTNAQHAENRRAVFKFVRN